MVWENKESWMELCELAAQEKDATKLMALIGEIERLLEAKQQRVAKAPDLVAEALVAENPAKKLGDQQLFDTVPTVLPTRGQSR